MWRLPIAGARIVWKLPIAGAHIVRRLPVDGAHIVWRLLIAGSVLHRPGFVPKPGPQPSGCAGAGLYKIVHAKQY